jgi:hypothetical protein
MLKHLAQRAALLAAPRSDSAGRAQGIYFLGRVVVAT